MSPIPFFIECAKLAIVGLILFFVVEMIETMPVWARRVVQLLIVLVCILSALGMATATTAPHDMGRPLSGIPAPPSICKGC